MGLAEGIKDKGQAVGVSGVCSEYTRHAVLSQNGSVTDLGSLGGVLNSFPSAINSRGQVVGYSDLPGDTTLHAFLWTEEDGMQDLGTVSGDSASLSFGINDKGQVLGGSCIDATTNICRAFLWHDGVMTDLNTLICPGSSLYLDYAGDINDRGEIVGQAIDLNTGAFVPFLAVPTDRGDDCEANPSAGQKLILREDVRQKLRQRRGFGRFTTDPTRHQ